MTQAEIKQFETHVQRQKNPAINYAGKEGRTHYFCGGGVWYDVIEYKNGKVTVSLETMNFKKTRLGKWESSAEMIADFTY